MKNFRRIARVPSLYRKRVTSIFPFDEKHPYLPRSINHKYLNEASARNKRGKNKKNDPPCSIF